MSKRDKAILIVLFIALLGGAIYYFGHTYLSSELDTLKMEKSNVQAINNNLVLNMGRLQEIEELIPIYERLISNVAENYTREFDQEEYILHLKSFLDDSNILLRSLVHSYDIPVSVESEDYRNSQNSESDDSVIMAYTSYALQFECSYEELLTFLRLTEESGRGFASSQVVISGRARTGDNLSVNMQLKFHYLANIDDITVDVDFSQILDNSLFQDERASIFKSTQN